MARPMMLLAAALAAGVPAVRARGAALARRRTNWQQRDRRGGALYLPAGRRGAPYAAPAPCALPAPAAQR